MSDSFAVLVDDFAGRHIGPDDEQVGRMLEVLGHGSLDDLIAAAVPDSIRIGDALGLNATPVESDALAALRALADRNEVVTTLIGCGYYGTHTPNVILRNILENPAWYTAYTPYQPEISQGRLEALLNFQTVVADLTGMEIANASLLDEATAAAEAMTLARRQSKVAGTTFFVDADCHPQVVEVVETRAEPLGIKVVVGDPDTDLASHEPFGLLLAYPGSSGQVRDHAELVATAHAAGAVVCVVTDLLALTLLRPPGEWGADVVVGSAQRFGVPLGYGGPHAGFMATSGAARRSLPGRLVGVSVDTEGRPAYRLALQTREQHIRREKATSNICTAQVLLAVMAATYAVYHGPDGLRRIGRRVHGLAAAAASALEQAGHDVVTTSFFDTVTVRSTGGAAAVVGAALERGLNLRLVSEDLVAFSLDETTTPAIVSDLLAAFGVDVPADSIRLADALPTELRRTSDFLTHPTFHRHHSETDLMRYLRRLADKDLALDRTMIPLGSCTMKLNAAAEMIPVTWPEFGAIHPFAPADQAEGYLALVDDLERALIRITGYDAVSFQPTAGSQGELAGLLA
ncbi:MAG: glycine dehydrogenase (aminomethyl-transferring), partial [Acidimicrobiales bacterium]